MKNGFLLIEVKFLLKILLIKKLCVPVSMKINQSIIDEDRMMNAQRFEETFYSPKKEDAGKELEKKAEAAQESDQELLMKLLAKPEMPLQTGDLLVIFPLAIHLH